MPLILVAGDVHGNLDDLFAVADEAERRFGPVAAILQAGDMGAFSYESRLDSATARFFKKDPTELGVAAYVRGDKPANRDVFFCRGNHEDFALLESSGGYLDPGGRIRWIKDGEVVEVCGLRVGALGGVHYRGDDAAPDPKCFTPSDLNRMRRKGGGLQVLLTHDGPTGFGVQGNPQAGSEALAGLVRDLQPALHFFAHFGHPPRPGRIGRTLVVPLNQPDVMRIPNRDGGLGLLDAETERFRFLLPDWTVPQNLPIYPNGIDSI